MKFLISFLVVFSLYTFSYTAKADTAPAPVVQAVVAPLPDTAPPALHLPPPWLAKALDVASSVPIVGPIVVTAAKWLGVVASLATLLVTFLLGLIRVLGPVLNLAKLASIAAAIQAFENGTIMYWLKFFSMYNAKKPDGVDILSGSKQTT